MTRKTCPFLAVWAAFFTGALHGGDFLDTVRGGEYAHSSGFHSDVKILNWNIDRGKNLDRIEAAMRDTRPDLCIFQEVDLGARRTRGQDVARELAETFGLNFAFAPEFRELSQSTRDGPAYHGQAILTSLPIRSSRILRFTRQSGFWKPRPLLVSSLPILQRREGGRVAQIAELDNGGELLVVYNLHLESRGDEQLRLAQLEEVLADAAHYPAETPLLIAGDFNTKSRHSPLIPRLNQAGYRSAFGDRRVRTHLIIGALDWVFARGPVRCQGASVLRNVHASDHFPISLDVQFPRASPSHAL